MSAKGKAPALSWKGSKEQGLFAVLVPLSEADQRERGKSSQFIQEYVGKNDSIIIKRDLIHTEGGYIY